jgi:hypothetical protein
MNGKCTPNEFLDNIKIHDVKCDCDHGKYLYEQILGDVYEDEAMVYCTCAHTTVAATKRQIRKVPYPDQKIMSDFLMHSFKLIEEDIGEELNHFGYSFEDWMNKLDTAKYNDMKDLNDILNSNPEVINIPTTRIKKLTDPRFHSLVKIELQKKDGKPRMICMTPKINKYVMGPVTLKLEEICGEKLRGYCKGESNNKLAHEFNNNLKDGFCYIVQGDMSGYDGSQNVINKAIDRYIYKRVADKVYHVSKQQFLKISQKHINTISIDYKKNNQDVQLMEIDILGTVFSGASDTTLMNTIRTAMYIRYVNDKNGLVYGVDYKCYCKGDDFIVFYRNKYPKSTLDSMYYAYFMKAVKLSDLAGNYDDREYGLGQVLKFLKVGDITSLDYLSLRAFYKNEKEIVLVRNPEKFFDLSRYSRKTKNMKPIETIGYLLDQAESLRITYGGIDIFDKQANLYVEKAKQIAKDVNMTHAVIQKCLKKKLLTKKNRQTLRRFKACVDESKNKDSVLYNISPLKDKKRKPDGITWWDWQKLEQSHVDVDQHDIIYLNREINSTY